MHVLYMYMYIVQGIVLGILFIEVPSFLRESLLIVYSYMYITKYGST